MQVKIIDDEGVVANETCPVGTEIRTEYDPNTNLYTCHISRPGQAGLSLECLGKVEVVFVT